MLNKVRAFIEQHGLLQPGERIGVAVSGGVDSVVLLHVLRALTDYRLDLTVCHIDHGLRPDSGRDADFVRGLAQSLGLPLLESSPDVRGHARARHVSLEMAARELRYAELRRMAAASRLMRIALAHHADDQIETILLRIIRGAGLEGLSGMAPRREDGGFIRPLLAVERAQILDYAAANKLAWVEDASNRDFSILRNRVRGELLPLLRSGYNPRFDRALLGMAAVARETMLYLESLLEQAWPSVDARATASGLDFDGNTLAALAPPLVKLAVRRLYAEAGGDPGRLSLPATNRFAAFIHGAGGRRLSLPGGFRLARLGRRFLLAGNAAALPMPVQYLAVPGRFRLADGRAIAIEPWQGNLPAWRSVGQDEAFVDADLLAWPLEARSRRPGDRLQPLGLSGEKKVKEIMIEARIPRECRQAVPVIADASGRIVWLAGLRLAHRFRVTSATAHVLHLTLSGRADPGET